jgi:biotin carboxyl carrier protein
MTFEIEVNGRPHTVTVERAATAPHQYRVTVDGESVSVDAVAVDDATLSIRLPDGTSQPAGISAGHDPGRLVVHLRGGVVDVLVNGRRLRHGDEAAGLAGEQRIVAPMPGRVIRVLAAVGDTVAPRQPVVVVEAMKMENELSSPRAGRVKEILVSEGTSVEAGRLLAIVE